VLLAASALVFVLVGLVAWLWVHQRWPEVGRSL
jgi:hypothetical protein